MSASDNALPENDGKPLGDSGTAKPKRAPRKQTFTERWRRMSLPNQLMFLATFVIAAATVVNVIVFTAESISSSNQTDNLVRYAKVQANASSDQADAAQQFSDTAEDINSRMSDAVDQLTETANSAKASIRATQGVMRLDQRAWVANAGMAMNPPELGKKWNGYVAWSNSGKTFAKQGKPRCHWVVVVTKIQSEHDLMKLVPNTTTTESIGVLGPSAQYKTIIESKGPIDVADKARIEGNYTYMWGEMTYKDIFERPHTTVYCSWRQGATGEFLQCPFHNDAD